MGLAGGYCAFVFAVLEKPEEKRRHIVSVRRAGNGAALPGTPILLDRPEVEDGDRPAMAGFLLGQIDRLRQMTRRDP